jgi:hypothetical protein
MRRGGSWVFAAVAAGVLYALGIHRYSWQYEAIIAGVLVVAVATKFVHISFQRRNDGSGEEPAGEVTHEHSIGRFAIQVEREPAPPDANQVFKQAPGSDAVSAEGDR